MQFDTYLINVEPGNVLNLNNNCFFSNVVEGRGLVHLDAKESLGTIENNTGGGLDPMLTDCDFVHLDENDTGTTCIGFDDTTCSVEFPQSPGSLETTTDGCSAGLNCSSISPTQGFGWHWFTALAPFFIMLN